MTAFPSLFSFSSCAQSYLSALPLPQASLGTTKYCSYFLKSMQCPKPDCMYLHELGDEAASFTKEEMQVRYGAPVSCYEFPSGSMKVNLKRDGALCNPVVLTCVCVCVSGLSRQGSTRSMSRSCCRICTR